MTIQQEPVNGSLYFQKAVPDIIIVKTDNPVSVAFELKIGAATIIQESYIFDNYGFIRIRNIYEIVEKYLNSTALLQTFTYTITQGVTVHTSTFTVLKCDAEFAENANTWTANKFLTRSSEKRTSVSRNEYLSFLQKSAHGILTVNFLFTYLVDGALSDFAGTLPTLPAVQTDTIVTFGTSLGAVITAVNAISPLPFGIEILTYQIWLTGTDLESVKYTYMVDNAFYRHKKNFVFENCFGVLETFTATGSTDAKKTAEFNLGNIENHYRKITQDFVNEKTCNSGFLSAMEMDWIDDLLLSYAVGLYTPGVSGMSEEITIVGFDKTDTEANQLQAFTFSYRKSKNNHREFNSIANRLFDYTFDNTFN